MPCLLCLAGDPETRASKYTKNSTTIPFFHRRCAETIVSTRLLAAVVERSAIPVTATMVVVRRVAEVRKESDVAKRARSSHGLRAYAAFSGEPLGLLGGTMTVLRPASMKDLRPVVVATGAEEAVAAAAGSAEEK